MSTIINTPPNMTTDDSASSSVAVVAIVLILAVAGVLFVMYGLPAIQNNTTETPGTTNINVELPSVTPPTPTPAPQQ
jgi:hypothetical protein